MLWYKEWRESRTRFLISAAFVIGMCVVFVLFEDFFRAQMAATSAPLNTYVGFIYRRVYAGFVRGMFTMLALILGLGGLQRERGRQTIGFTLALPVSRWRLAGVRAAVGLIEIVALSLLPAILIPGLSPLVHQSYPLSQALQFSVLWMAIGSVLFAAGFLASTLLANEYSALTVSFIAFYFYPLVVVRTPFLQSYPLHIHYIMNGTGMPYFDPRSDLLIAVPWVILSAIAVVTLTLIALSGRITQAQDF